VRPASVTDHPDLRYNVGWQAWTMGNRVSRVERWAHTARRIVDDLDSSSSLSPDQLTAALDLLEALGEDARRATETWERIASIIAEDDPSLIEHPDDGISIIHNHGSSNPLLMERVRSAWGDGSVVVDGRRHFERFEALVGKGSRTDI
jgi:hypothetical protein